MQVEPVSCERVEFNPGGPNVNVVVYRDQEWAHDVSAIALTSLTFGTETGQILAADLELNSAFYEFSVTDDSVMMDLRATLTHELGHVLGLAHSNHTEATMFSFQDFGETKKRDLDLDDVHGICAIYPPGVSPTCDPLRDFSERCGGNVMGDGCALEPAAARMPGVPLGLGLGALGFVAMSRRAWRRCGRAARQK